MSFTVVIPARYGSTRLPGKPLLDIAGKPMVQRVWEQASRSAASSLVIATDDTRIRDVAQGFGAQVCMTSSEHPSGTDRLRRCVLIREGINLSNQFIRPSCSVRDFRKPLRIRRAS